MAEHGATNTNTRFYSVSAVKNRLYQSSKTPKDGFEKVETPSGVSYHRYLSGVSGYITGAKVENGKFGDNFRIFIEDEGETYSISVKISSRASRPLLHTLFNVDTSKKVQISFYPKDNPKDADRPYQGVSVGYIDEPKIEVKEGVEVYPSPEWYEMKGIPEPVQRRNGKWDYTNQEDYLYSEFEKFAKRIDNNEPTKEKEVQKSYSAADDDIDDLPF